MTILRTLWPSDFPEVIVHTTVAVRDAHPDYVAAKAGEPGAAVRLISALLSDAAVTRLGELLGDRRPLIVPVRAVEVAGINLIPDAMAHELGQRLGLPVTSDIVQTNMVGHTRASGFHRLTLQPTFAGDVHPDCLYLLVDDHVGLGGTSRTSGGTSRARGAGSS